MIIMKRYAPNRYGMLAFALICTFVCFAHPGGHYHKGDGTVFSCWQLKTGEVIKGNFSSVGNGSVILEQEEGRLVEIPIQDLSAQDQQLAKFRIKRYERMNTDAVVQPATMPSHQKNNDAILLLTVVLAGVSFYMIHRAIHGFKKESGYAYRFASLAYLLPLAALSIFGSKKTADQFHAQIPPTPVTYLDSAFAPYKPAVSTRWDKNYYYVSSTGIPAHNMMVGITHWQQQVPLPQNYTGNNSWPVPLQPVYADEPMSTRSNFMKGAIAIAVNGVPVFNALNNRGEDAYLVGELDKWGGHCGRGDDYHYHIAPLHLSSTSGLMPIAFAMDGFAVYGTKEPDGSPMQLLDSCHGHAIGKFPYHYHGTNSYPYMIGAMRGKVTTDPSTPAPENQVIPQAFASPLRKPAKPLRGAEITAFVPAGKNRYLLTYTISGKPGYVNYSWDSTGRYTFNFTDIAGTVTNAVYQRR